MAGKVNIGGNTASVQLTGNDAITADQEIGFPNTNGDSAVVIVTPTSQDIETTGDIDCGSITAAGPLTVEADNSSGWAAYLKNTTNGNANGLVIGTPNRAGSSSLFGLRIENSAGPVIDMTTDGSITAAGKITAGEGIANTKAGVELRPAGAIFAKRTDADGNSVFVGYNTGGTITTNILGNGNITTAGAITSQGYAQDPSRPAGGVLNGGLLTLSRGSGEGILVGYTEGTNTAKVELTADGNISIAGSKLRGYSDTIGGTRTFSIASADGGTSFNGKMNLSGLSESPSAGQTLKRNGSTKEIYADTSSIRFKRNVEDADLDLCLSIVKNVRPVWYRSKQIVDNPRHSFWGFIAEEVDQVEPRLVSYDENKLPYAVGYDRFVPVLTKALQSALTRIEALEAQLTELKGGSN